MMWPSVQSGTLYGRHADDFFTWIFVVLSIHFDWKQMCHASSNQIRPFITVRDFDYCSSDEAFSPR